MTDELLRDLAKDLPFERPTAARRDAIRSSLLVEAAASTARPVASRRWPIVVGFAAGALAAAAIAMLVIRRPVPVIERANLAQVRASSPDVRIEHQIVATERGSDEIVRIREGTLALAIPAQQRGDRMVVRTTTADVEGDAGELEVTVANDQLQTVKVKTGTARVIVLGQMPVTLSAGQVWRASVITADLTPGKPAAAAMPTTPPMETRAPTPAPQPPSGTASAATSPQTQSGLASAATSPQTQPGLASAATSPAAPQTQSGPATAATPRAPGARSATRPPSAPAIAATPTSPSSGSAATPRSPGARTATPSLSGPPIATSPSSGPAAPRSPGARTATPPTQSEPAVAATPSAATPSATTPRVEPIAPPRTPSIEQRFQRGFALLKAGNAQQAADELGAAADASPTSPLAADARYFQAVALVRANDPRAAERVLVQFLDAAPMSLRRGRAAVLLGRLLAERGDPKTARAWLETAASDPDPAVAAAAKAGLQALAPKP